MSDKFFIALDEHPLGVLQPYLAPKNYIGNVVSKFPDPDGSLYILLHFTKDSPFTGYKEIFPL